MKKIAVCENCNNEYRKEVLYNVGDAYFCFECMQDCLIHCPVCKEYHFNDKVENVIANIDLDTIPICSGCVELNEGSIFLSCEYCGQYRLNIKSLKSCPNYSHDEKYLYDDPYELEESDDDNW